MFERIKIRGSIDYFLRSARMKQGMGRTKVEVWLSGHTRPYAKEMRRQRLTSDQAAVRLITDLVATMSVEDVTNLRAVSPELVGELKALFLVCDTLLKSKPEQFGQCFRVPPEGTFYALVTS